MPKPSQAKPTPSPIIVSSSTLFCIWQKWAFISVTWAVVSVFLVSFIASKRCLTSIFCNVDLFFTSVQMMTHISSGVLSDFIFEQRCGKTEDMGMCLHKASFCSYMSIFISTLSISSSVVGLLIVPAFMNTPLTMANSVGFHTWSLRNFATPFVPHTRPWPLVHGLQNSIHCHGEMLSKKWLDDEKLTVVMAKWGS